MANNTNQTYDVIGLMSGTSLDGLDMAFCRFTADNNTWNFEIVHSETKPYSAEWRERLSNLDNATTLQFLATDIDYGNYLGRCVSDFIIKNRIKADFVSSHGHTIFHQPENKLTVQIGNGNAIAAACKLPVVCDFRSLDVALGGQGAPLVPIGDKMLFSEYDYCLNLGGFANLSYDLPFPIGEGSGERRAFDICPVNIVMNAICEKMGKPYDDKGEIARSGLVSKYLLNEFNQLSFYRQAPNKPKSLGKEWVVQHIDPIIEQYEVEQNDLLSTFVEHVAIQISKAVDYKKATKLLVTGGGAYNDFLIEKLRELIPSEIIIPDKRTIEFKEALIFAFLGVLRMRNEINCLKSVTGAREDNCGGAVYFAS